MKKILIWILLLSMLLTIVSCDMSDVSSTDCECPNCKGSSGATTAATDAKFEPPENEFAGYYFGKKAYEENILNGQMRDGFLYAEHFLEWGGLRSMTGIYTYEDGGKSVNQYKYCYELVGDAYHICLNIMYTVDNFAVAHYYNLSQFGVALILDHPSDDLRKCPY